MTRRGGFAIEIKFDENGTWLLEQYSAANPGRHFVIFGQWSEKLADGRWLAAPLITHRIGDGVLAFTPDCSREEADQLVLGLNNAAKEIHKNDAKMIFPAVGRAIFSAVALSLGLGASLFAQSPFQFPTANHALYEMGDELKFFAPTAPDKPWTTGSFGCVRTDGRQMHEGLDIRCLQRDRHGEPTDPVMATADGTVVYFSTKPALSNYGKYVVIRHIIEGIEIYSLYAHLSEIQPGLAVGKPVKAGEVIATMGRTSNTGETITKDRAHVHFELNVFVNEGFAGWYQTNLSQTAQRPRHLERPEPQRPRRARNSARRTQPRRQIQPAEFHPRPDRALPRAGALDEFSLPETLSDAGPAQSHRPKGRRGGL